AKGRGRQKGGSLADPRRGRCRPHRQGPDKGWRLPDGARAPDRPRWTARRLFCHDAGDHVRNGPAGLDLLPLPVSYGKRVGVRGSLRAIGASEACRKPSAAAAYALPRRISRPASSACTSSTLPLGQIIPPSDSKNSALNVGRISSIHELTGSAISTYSVSFQPPASALPRTMVLWSSMMMVLAWALPPISSKP